MKTKRFSALNMILFAALLTIAVWAVSHPQAALAQSGCALVINEVLYGGGINNPDEQVELYVVTDITADTTFYLTDLDEASPAVNYHKVFTLTAPVSSGTYIWIHGATGTDGTVTTTGPFTAINFYGAKPSGSNHAIHDSGDDIVLYIGMDTLGTACDYVQVGDPTGPAQNGTPSGFSWDTSCSNATSSDGTISVSLDFNGTVGDTACDWTVSGSNSPNNPSNLTYAPNSLGWENNSTPTAITLVNLTARSSSGIGLLAGVTALFVAVGVMVFLSRKRKSAFLSE